MQDRVPLYPGRVTLTPVSGQANTYDMARADQPSQEGTPLNKGSLLKDSTAALFGLGTDAVPDDALRAIPDRMEPIGTIKTTVRTDLGDNWLLCNGDEIDETEYPELAQMTGRLSGGLSPKYQDNFRHQNRPTQDYCAYSASDGSKIVTVVHDTNKVYFYVSTDLVNANKTSYTLSLSTDNYAVVGLDYINGYWVLLYASTGDTKSVHIKISSTADEGSWSTDYNIGNPSGGHSIGYATIAYSNGYYVVTAADWSGESRKFFSSQTLTVNDWTAYDYVLKDASGNACTYIGDLTADDFGNFYILGRWTTSYENPTMVFKFRPDTGSTAIVYTTSKYNANDNGYISINFINWINGQIVGFGFRHTGSNAVDTSRSEFFWTDDNFETVQTSRPTVPDWAHYSEGAPGSIFYYGKVYKLGTLYVIAARHDYESSDEYEVGVLYTDNLAATKWTLCLGDYFSNNDRSYGRPGCSASQLAFPYISTSTGYEYLRMIYGNFVPTLPTISPTNAYAYIKAKKESDST